MLHARRVSFQIVWALSKGCGTSQCAAVADTAPRLATACVGNGASLWPRRMSANGQGQPTTFNLAQPGEGIHECELLQWRVEVGQAVEEFDPLLEVQSDKANVEITSPYTGVIQALHGSVGDMIQVQRSPACPALLLAVLTILALRISTERITHVRWLLCMQVGAPLVDFEISGTHAVTSQAHDILAGQSLSSAQPPLSPQSEVNVATDSSDYPSDSKSRTSGRSADGGRTLASPAVRALAREHGIALAAINGSGPDGRVLKGDVLAFLDAGSAEAPAPTMPTTAHEHEACHTAGADAIISLRGYRRAMVHAMAASTAVPHFHLCDDVQLDALISTRDTLRARMHDIKLSLLPLLIKALSLALTQHPEVNARLGSDLQSLHLIRDHNVGIAIATEAGLVVPSIKAVQDLNVFQLAVRLDELKQRAHQAQLQPEDLAETSITLSNVGVIGGRYATPIVNTPQLAICALGRLRKGLVFPDGEQPQVAKLMSMSWGADHRALDGASLARFNNTWKGYIQDPVSMLLHTS
eukprot:jgi/Ulvmu1/3084/UM015_0124.1